jgi:hypothetical protein
MVTVDLIQIEAGATWQSATFQAWYENGTTTVIFDDVLSCRRETRAPFAATTPADWDDAAAGTARLEFPDGATIETNDGVTTLTAGIDGRIHYPANKSPALFARLRVLSARRTGIFATMVAAIRSMIR